MAKMVTLFGKDIKDLNYNELKRERSCQATLLSTVKWVAKTAEKEAVKRPSQKNKDKATLHRIYQKHLEALIEEIEYYLKRRNEPASNATEYHSLKKIRRENEVRQRQLIWDAGSRRNWNKAWNKDGFHVLWDRERFMLIANDRGFQTEEAVYSAIGEALHFERTRSRHILDTGRFTWGQVLVLGAYFEMTPKEFCDTFLSGYFVEQYGEYRADYEHIEVEELLKRAIKSDPLYGMEQTVIEVGSDGKPVDEEWWDD